MRTARQKKGSKDGPQRHRAQVARVMDNLSSAQRTVRRKVTLLTTLSTNGAGFIPATQVTSDGARGATDWGSEAALFLQFRVRAIRVILVPIVDMTTAVSAGGGAVTPHPTCIQFAEYGEGLGYANALALTSGASRKVFNGKENIIEYSVDWSAYPEAKLFSATNAAIPTAQVYGMQFQDTGAAPASAVSTVYYRWITEWDCEFLFPQ